MTPGTGGRRSLLRQSAVLYSATYVAIVFKFLGGLIVAGVLGPALFGIRNLFGLTMEYQQYSHAGTLNAMRRQVPFYRGSNDEEMANLMMASVLAGNLLYAAIAAIGLVSAAIWLRATSVDPIVADFLLFLAAYIPLEKARMYFSIRLAIDDRAGKLGKARILHQLSGAVLTVGGAILFGLRGLLVALFLAEVVTVAYLLAACGTRPWPRLSFSVLASLIRIGFPIMLIGVAFMLLRSVDRLVVAGALSTEMLGLFALATIVSGVVSVTLSDVINATYFPRLMEKVGAGSESRDLLRYVVQPTVLIAFFLPFLIGVLQLTVHLPVQYFLSDYTPGLPAAKLLIVAAFFFCVPVVPMLACVALSREFLVLAIAMAALVLNAIASLVLVERGLGLWGAATGTAVAHFAFCTAIVCTAFGQLGASWLERSRLLLLLYAPIVYACALLFLLERLLATGIDNLWQDLAMTGGKLAVYVLAYALILLPLRRHPAFVRLASYWPDRLSRRKPGVHGEV
jgi:O-antigen/teichoic acid export membrane protein